MVHLLAPIRRILRRLRARSRRRHAETRAAAALVLRRFDGDLGAARNWAIDEAIRWDQAGDRRRNLAAIRIARRLRVLARREIERRRPDGPAR